MSINVTEEFKEGILVLKLKGRLDAIALPIVEKQINQHIDSGKTKVILDFAEVDYLSSAGMRLLLSATKKLKSIAGRLALCTVTEQVMQIIKLAGFDHILAIQPSEVKAIELLKA
ncbi:MAG: spoIiaa [Chlamydiales bacterium]|jgi:anti-sigma B factor antagonist/stage II sporulation protein AA (anti-sigma F factor antagonist)|nr:spoIiaa [Chlamydiales bacterium]